jgi:hypothetical protein
MNYVTRYIVHVTAQDRESLRARSSAVFGNRYFAEVVAAVADEAPTSDTRVTVRMLAARTGLTDSLVKLVIRRLVSAELLRPLPQSRSRGPRYHEIQLSGGLWDVLVDFCLRLGRESSDGPS